ncbi:unnamed protein product [Calypogeia fissa]
MADDLPNLDIMEELRALRAELRALRAEMRVQTIELQELRKLTFARDFNVYARLQNSRVRTEAQELAVLRSVSTNLVNEANLNEAIPHFPENVRALRRMNAGDLRRILEAVDVEYEVEHARKGQERTYLQKKVIKAIGVIFDLDL